MCTDAKGECSAGAGPVLLHRMASCVAFAASFQQTTEAMADKNEVIDAIGKFDATKLKKTETKESNTLPTKESKHPLYRKTDSIQCDCGPAFPPGAFTYPLPPPSCSYRTGEVFKLNHVP